MMRRCRPRLEIRFGLTDCVLLLHAGQMRPFGFRLLKVGVVVMTDRWSRFACVVFSAVAVLVTALLVAGCGERPERGGGASDTGGEVRSEDRSHDRSDAGGGGDEDEVADGEEALPRIRDRIESSSAAPALPSRRELGEVAGDTIEGYFSEDASGFLAMLRSQGIEPNERMLGDFFADDVWPRMRRVFAGGVFDLDGIEMRDEFARGPYSEPARPGYGSRVARRDAGRAFLDRIDERELEKAELVLPGRFTAQDGTEFDGTFVFVFAFNPEDERWVLIEMRTYGVPNGVDLLLPTL